jgi:outer membrane protein assembly factor BamB
LNQKGLAVGIVVLFIGSSALPILIGSNVTRVKNQEFTQEEEYQQYFNNWSIHLTNKSNDDESNNPIYMDEGSSNEANIQLYSSSMNGPMDSAWPMLSHDIHHTGNSQYSTVGNLGAEIWRVHGDETGAVESTAVIDKNGIAYFGTLGADSSLYAMYPNGTRKWRYNANNLIWSTPAIADDGTIYLPSWGSNLIALYPNGQVKWEVNVQDPTGSSVTIGEDGTIYIGTMAGNLYAIDTNGSERWHLYLGGNLISSPAIGLDNTIYIGTTSNYLYAVYPNGIVRWQFAAGQFKGNPSIAEDGTIYAPSFDGYLYALYPGGTMKWRASTGDSIAAAGVALASDGTIYVGTDQLRAYYPDGTLKWCTNLQGSIYGTVPAVSADGTIYVSAGGSLVAVNPDCTEKWRKQLTTAQIMSSPSIGPDNRVYVGSEEYGISPYGYLHAFGIGPLRAEAGGPYQGTALRPISLTGLAFGGIPPYQYHWDFGDGNTSIEINPTHTYATAGNYTATFTIIDQEGNSSSDTTTVSMDYPLPTLTIIKPTNAFYIVNKQIFSFPFPFILGRITIQVTVEDHYSIDKVIFCIRDDVVYTGTTPPYEWTWTQRNFQLKTNIYAIAYDVKGRYAEQRIQVIKLF